MQQQRRSALATLSMEEQQFLENGKSEQSRGRRIETVPESKTNRSYSIPTIDISTPGARLIRATSLRSVTLRLHPEIATALRRASIERSLDYEEPYTQQSIAEQALREWFASNGYIDE